MEEKVNKQYVCECGREFLTPNSFNGHKSYCKIHHQIKGTYDKMLEDDRNRHNKAKKTMELKKKIKDKENLLIWISEKHTCEKCGKVMTEKFGSGRFCSRSCANSKDISDDVKQKIGATMKSYVKDHPEWFFLHGKEPSEKQIKYFSSKAERELRKNLQEKLPDYNFTTGSFTKYKNEILNSDIYSRKYKIVIEYDGDWHFIDIIGQLEQKQHKDKLLYNFILESDFRLIRIDEKYKFTLEEIISYILNDSRKIILLGNRYNYLIE